MLRSCENTDVIILKEKEKQLNSFKCRGIKEPGEYL